MLVSGEEVQVNMTNVSALHVCEAPVMTLADIYYSIGMKAMYKYELLC